MPEEMIVEFIHRKVSEKYPDISVIEVSIYLSRDTWVIFFNYIYKDIKYCGGVEMMQDTKEELADKVSYIIDRAHFEDKTASTSVIES